MAPNCEVAASEKPSRNGISIREGYRNDLWTELNSILLYQATQQYLFIFLASLILDMIPSEIKLIIFSIDFLNIRMTQ